MVGMTIFNNRGCIDIHKFNIGIWWMCGGSNSGRSTLVMTNGIKAMPERKPPTLDLLTMHL